MRNFSTNVLMVLEDQLKISFIKQHNLLAIRALAGDKGLCRRKPWIKTLKYCSFVGEAVNIVGTPVSDKQKIPHGLQSQVYSYSCGCPS